MHLHHLETERLYNIPYGQSSRKLKLARAEPSKLTTIIKARAKPSKPITSSGRALEITPCSGRALETYNLLGQSPRNLQLARAEPSKLTTSSGKALETYN